MKRLTKAISMFLAIIMVIGLLPLSVIAEDIQNTHTVQFKLNYNGAHKIPSQKVADGECAVQPENVTREGWIFEYWYVKTGDNGIQKFDLSQPITEDATLYARWDEDITYWGPIWSRNILNGIAESEKEDETEKPDDDTDNEEDVKDTFTVTFDVNIDGIANPPVNQIITTGEYAIEPTAPIKDGYYLLGWYLNKGEVDYSNKFRFEITPIQADITLYALWMNIELDSDGDELPDELETYLGTDMNNEDSDGDGINDWHEVVTLGSNPLSTDTDNDGISDYQEDTDNDGLSDGDELSSTTNPLVEDTDGDGLSDYDEIYTYHTNPANEDTDGDGVADGVEKKLNSDLLIANANFTDYAEAQEVSETNPISANVEATVTGEAYGSVMVNPVTFADNMFLSQTIPGWLGSAYEFTSEEPIISAVITFEYDTTIAADKIDFEPRIYYFNPETQDFEELSNQNVENGVVSAEVNHFSTYILLDKTEYDNKAVSTANHAIALTVDDPDINDDYLPDCYNELIYSGKITLKSGSKAFVGYRFDGSEGKFEDDYDGDGLLNGEEIEIRTDENGNPYFFIISSPILADSDFDGYEDHTEIIRGTDPLTYTYNISAVDGLYNNERYKSYQLAASVNEIGLHYTTLTLFTVLGAITDGVDIEEIYRQEWFSYFNNYAEGAYKDVTKHHESDMWIMNIVSMIDDINEKIGDHLGMIGDASGEIGGIILNETGIQEFIDQRTRLNNVLEDIRKSDLKSTDFNRYIEELKDVAVKQNELFEKYGLDYNSEFQVKLVNWTVDEKKLTKIFNVGSDIVSGALDIISLVNKCSEVINLYAQTNANIQLYKDNIDIFTELKKSPNYSLHRAAYEIWILLENDADDFSVLCEEAIGNIIGGYITKQVWDTFTDKLGKDFYLKTLIFIAEQVIKVGVDMATAQNKTIASVNLTLATMRVLDTYLDNYSTNNKFMSDRYLTHVAQMRLVNELRYNDCKNDPSFIAEQVQSVIGWADALHLHLSDDLLYDCKEVVRPCIKGYIHISNAQMSATIGGTKNYVVTKEIDDYFAGTLEVYGRMGYYEIYLTEGDHEITIILDENGSSWSHNITIEAGETLELDFYLDAKINDIKLKGNVTDKVNGGPVKGALVRFREGLDNTSGDYMNTVATALTDDDGKFTSEIPTGSYTIEIMAPQYVTAYANVEATQNRTVEVQLQKYGTVDFVVIDKDHIEQNGVTVTVTASDGTQSTVSAPCSKYMAPGTYTASADINGTTVTKTFTLGTSSIIVTLQEPTTYIDNLPENMDFGGKSLRFIVDNEGDAKHLNMRSILGDENSGDVVAEAVHKRNKIVADRLNISINVVKTDTAANINTYISTSVLSGDNTYDVAETMYNASCSLGLQGYLYDADDLENINQYASYWEAEFNGNASCANYLPFVTGDIALQQHGAYYATFVNADIWDQVSDSADIYKEVNRSHWTLDVMNQYITKAANSSSGTKGLVINKNHTIDALGTGSGVLFSSHPFTEYTDLIFEDEHTYTVYEKLYSMICGNSGSTLLDETSNENALSKFKEGNTLFAVGTLNQASSELKGMVEEYYIIPLPKYSETSDYHTRMAIYITVFSVPIVADSDFTSAALEALASESYRTVTSSYTATMFDSAYQADDSNAMLRFIKDCTVMDFAAFYPGTTVSRAFVDSFSSDVNPSSYSTYEAAHRKAWEEQFDDICERFNKLTIRQFTG